MPPQPCKHCRFADHCPTIGLVNRLAVECWLQDMPFECGDFQAEHYHGIEGVFA